MRNGITIRWRAAALALIVCLAAVLPCAGGRANALEISQKNLDSLKSQGEQLASEIKKLTSDIQTAEKNKTNALKIKADLDKKIGLTEDQIELYEAIIAQLEAQIELRQENITETSAQEKETYELFKLRMRRLYEQGQAGYLQVFFGAQSFSDLLSRADVIGTIAEHDARLMARLKELREKIEGEKAAITNEKIEDEEIKAELEQRKVDLEKQYSENESYINRLEGDVGRYREAYEAAEKSQEKIRKDIQTVAAELAKKNVYVGGKFIWPLPSQNNTITSLYGTRWHPILKAYRFHTGIDIAASKGTAIYAVNGGEVVMSDYDSGYGNFVSISHGGGVVTLYAHMTSRAVKKGQIVKQGQVIGYVGSTGLSTGPHLHFEVMIDGKNEDPMKNSVNTYLLKK